MHVDFILEPELLRDAAAVRAVHERRVGLIEQNTRAVLLRHGYELGERAYVAVHRVDAFDGDELLASRLLELLLEIRRIVVAEKAHVRLRENRAVHDARMRILVGDDPVARTHERRDHSDVRAVAGGEHHDRFLLLELCECRFELAVHVHRAAQDRRAGRTESVFLDRCLPRLDHFTAVG